MTRFILIAAAALMLGGCLSSAEIERLDNERDISRCKEFGFKPGTESFARCRFELDQRRADERTAFRNSPFGPPIIMTTPGRCWNTLSGLYCDPW